MDLFFVFFGVKFYLLLHYRKPQIRILSCVFTAKLCLIDIHALVGWNDLILLQRHFNEIASPQAPPVSVLTYCINKQIKNLLRLLHFYFYFIQSKIESAPSAIIQLSQSWSGTHGFPITIIAAYCTFTYNSPS
jgi:hypothetical protein